MQNLTPVDVTPLALGPLQIILRMVFAMVVGTVVGIEREYTHRPAGMRTHMLVAVGACAVMMTSQLIFWMYRPYGATPDPARLPAQIITGMGFLGAGTIIKEGASIKGLTTAASIWATACLGIAVGGGYFWVAGIGTVCMLITLIIFEWLQRKLMENHYGLYRFTVDCTDLAGTMELIDQLAAEADARVDGLHVEDRHDGGFIINFRMNVNGRHAGERMHRFLAALSEDEHTDHVSSERSRV